MINKITFFSMLSFVRRHIRLTDACLLVFMVILMLQSVYNLFFRELVGLGGGTVDVVVRTTAAAIYGYFIGAGFLRDEVIEQKGKMDLSATRIQVADSSQTIHVQTDYTKRRARQQVAIVAIIGIFSLTVLIIVNNFFGDLPTTAIATVSQLRDFISGSVGLLIGNSTRANR